MFHVKVTHNNMYMILKPKAYNDGFTDKYSVYNDKEHTELYKEFDIL
jgi:hypothetical protein